MSKTSMLEHMDDIDFRTHAERSKNWKEDFLDWYKQLTNYQKKNGLDERISGQITMLSSVLWYLLDPKEYKALVRGKIYINVESLSGSEKKLFTSMMAFKGSPYCNKDSVETVKTSYLLRAKPQYAELYKKHSELVDKIAHNIAN